MSKESILRFTIDVLKSPGAILVTGLVKGLASYIQITSLQFMSHRIIEKLRRDVFHNLINLHYGFFVQNKTGSLITRITTDTFYLSGAMANTYTALIKDSLTDLNAAKCIT